MKQKILLDGIPTTRRTLDGLIARSVNTDYKIICVGGNSKDIIYSKTPKEFKYGWSG